MIYPYEGKYPEIHPSVFMTEDVVIITAGKRDAGRDLAAMRTVFVVQSLRSVAFHLEREAENPVFG